MAININKNIAVRTPLTKGIKETPAASKGAKAVSAEVKAAQHMVKLLTPLNKEMNMLLPELHKDNKSLAGNVGLHSQLAGLLEKFSKVPGLMVAIKKMTPKEQLGALEERLATELKAGGNPKIAAALKQLITTLKDPTGKKGMYLSGASHWDVKGLISSYITGPMMKWLNNMLPSNAQIPSGATLLQLIMGSSAILFTAVLAAAAMNNALQTINKGLTVDSTLDQMQ